MAINFGLLQPIAPKQGVIATGTSTHSDAGVGNSLSSLAGGIAQGMEAGTKMKAEQQQMDQSAQLFPSVLQKSQADAVQAQNQATITGIQAKSATQQWNDLQQQRAAFSQNFNNGMQVIMKTNPTEGLKMQQTMAETQQALATAANQIADTKQKQFAAYTSMTATGAKLATSAAQAEKQQPGMGQQVWEQGLKMMPESLSSLYPQQFTPSTNMVMVKLGADSVFNMQQQQIMKNASPMEKDQIRRDGLQQKVQDGSATPQDKQDLQELNNKIQRSGNQLSTSEQVNKETTIASLKDIDKQADGASQDLQNYNMMKQITDKTDYGKGANIEMTGKQLLQSASKSLGFDYNPGTATDEGFKHLSTVLRLNYLSTLKGRPNMQEWNQVMDAVPQITNTKQGRDLMISMGQYIDTMKIQYRDFSHQWSDTHNGSVVGRDNAWNNYLSSLGSGYDPQKQVFNVENLNNGDPSKFLNDPAMAKPGAVKVADTAQNQGTSGAQSNTPTNVQVNQQSNQAQQTPAQQGNSPVPSNMPASNAAQQPTTKSLNGVNYIQQNGKWYIQQ